MSDYIKESELSETFRDAVTKQKPFFEPFAEFERIARNKPHAGIAKNLPRITDGSLASIIKESPKRIIQQQPTGKFITTKGDYLDIMAGWIMQNRILKYAKTNGTILQKSWAMISKAYTYGSQPAYVQFFQRDGIFYSDFTLPYVKDVFYEPGKTTDYDSDIMFLRAWYQPRQIQAIIDREKRMEETHKWYKTTWDLKALARIKDELKQKDQESTTPSEDEKGSTVSAIETVHAFQRGTGNMLYSFHPDTDVTVRKRTNDDIRGCIPIHTMYADVDLSNPLGRGMVEISGGLQNLIDSEVQAYQFNRSLNLAPPIKIRGIPKSTVRFAPNAIWDLGDSPEAMAEAVNISTTALESFTNNYSMLKSQLLNMNQTNDTSVGSESGNPGFSRVPAGVKAMEARMSVSDNYIRKQFEHTFGEIMETMMNLYFAGRKDVEDFDIDDSTAQKIEAIDPGLVNRTGGKNIVRVDFEASAEKIEFEVDASTSREKDDVEQRDTLLELLRMAGETPAMASRLGENGINKIIQRLIIQSGVENPEEILDAQEQGQGEQPEQPAGISQEQVQQMIDESVAKVKEKTIAEAFDVKYADLTPEEKAQVLGQLGIQASPAQPVMDINQMEEDPMSQEQLPPSEEEVANSTEEAENQLIDELMKRGFNDEQVKNAVLSFKSGKTMEEIIAELQTTTIGQEPQMEDVTNG